MRSQADLLLEAQAAMSRRVGKLKQKLVLPLMQEQFATQWAMMPNEMKEQFKNKRPEEYRMLMEMINANK